MKMNSKLTAYSLIAILIFCSLFSCSLNEKDKTGKQVFELLKGINQTGLSEFRLQFITRDDITQNKGIFNQDEFTSFQNSIESSYKILIEDGVSLKINWSEISYDNFDGVEYDNDGTKGFDGKLNFKSGGNSYYIRVITGKMKNGQKLVDLGSINTRTLN